MSNILTDIGVEIGRATDANGSSIVGFGGRWGRGSGFVIGPGRVLTNAHNLSEQEVRVSLENGRVETARVLGVDHHSDLALLEVDTGLTAVTWSPDEVSVTVGKPVLALANPGGRGLRSTIGFVAGVQRTFRGPRGRLVEGGFEHTALATPGSSGGPVLDIDGNLVGVNTRRLGRGFYLAQIADGRMKATVDLLEEGNPAEPRRLGVGLVPAEMTRGLRRSLGLDEVDGLLVRFVEENSAAAGAGVREGDVIQKVQGNPITDVDELLEALGAADESIELELVRLNDPLVLTVELK